MVPGQGIEPRFPRPERGVRPLDDPGIFLNIILNYVIIQSMFQKVLKFLDKILPAEIVYAHCDVPCGIYETSGMLTAAATIEKMVQKLEALEKPRADAPEEERLVYENTLTRIILEKEEQGEICKKELLILWTDYFKPEHLEMFPNLHETFWKAAKLCSKNKQNVSREAVEELKAAIQEINRIFKEAEKSKKLNV